MSHKEILKYRIHFFLKCFILTLGLMSAAKLRQKHPSHGSVAICCLATEAVSRKSRMQPKVITVIKPAIQVSGRLFSVLFFFFNIPRFVSVKPCTDLGFRGNVAKMLISGNKWLKNELLELKEMENTAAVK